MGNRRGSASNKSRVLSRPCLLAYVKFSVKPRSVPCNLWAGVLPCISANSCQVARYRATLKKIKSRAATWSPTRGFGFPIQSCFFFFTLNYTEGSSTLSYPTASVLSSSKFLPLGELHTWSEYYTRRLIR